jgi:hypothetical protein
LHGECRTYPALAKEEDRQMVLQRSAVLLTTFCLVGCYQSEQSIISAGDAFQPLKPGRYCEQPVNKSTGEWATRCEKEVVFTSGPGSAYSGDVEGWWRVMRIHRAPLGAGAFRGGYVTEACATAPRYEGARCVIGVVEILAPDRFIWTGPECNAKGDFCTVGSEPQVRQVFASRLRYSYRKRSRYIWVASS